MKKLVLLSAVSVLLFSCGYNNKQEGNVFIPEIPQTNEVQKTQVEEIIEYDPIVGSFKCDRTKDVYVFYSDETGQFFPMGRTPSSSFTWKRSGENVTILYEVYGEQKLKFNLTNKTITEKAESLGTLIFRNID